MEDLTCILDTSIFIDYFRRADKSKTLLFERFAVPGAALTAITLMELEFGTTSWGHREFLDGILQRYPVLPFDAAAGMKAGEIYRRLRGRNQAIEIRDLMIAAIALAQNLPLATLDRSHFERVDQLKLVDLG